MRAAAAGAVAGILGLVAAGVGQPPPPPVPPAPPAPAVKVPAGPAAPDPAPAAKAAPADGAKGSKAEPILPPDPALAAHIRNLGADDYHAREKAGKELERAGDKALPHLRKALAETDSPEVARRLSVLVRRMEYDRLVNPRRVTLAEKNRTIREAVDELARQTGYNIQYQSNGPAGDERHPIGFDNAPFWQALDALADLAGATVNVNGYDDDTVYLNAFGPASKTPFVAYAGPFKVAATNVQLSRSLPLTGGDARGIGFVRPQESVNVNFNIFAEPKNPLLGMPGQPVVVAAEDDLGQSMVPPRDPNQPFGGRTVYYGGGGGNRTYQMNGSLHLTRGGREARTVRTLKAKATLTLLSGIVPEVSVRDPLKAKNLKVTGRTVEVEVDSVVPQNNGIPGYSASLTIRKLGQQDPNFQDYSWVNSIHQKIELWDEKGNKYRSYGWNNMNNGPGWVSITLPFQATDRRGMQQKLGPPVRLVVNEWVQATHEVTFEFRDVPLP